MATTTELTPDAIDISLRTLQAAFDGIPDLAAAWPGYDDELRWHIGLDWSETFWRFRLLTEAAAAGQLTADQGSRYDRLVRSYEATRPIIKRLGLQTIELPQLTTHSHSSST